LFPSFTYKADESLIAHDVSPPNVLNLLRSDATIEFAASPAAHHAGLRDPRCLRHSWRKRGGDQV